MPPIIRDKEEEGKENKKKKKKGKKGGFSRAVKYLYLY